MKQAGQCACTTGTDWHRPGPSDPGTHAQERRRSVSPFTPRACNAIIDRNAVIVVRYNRARLVP